MASSRPSLHPYHCSSSNPNPSQPSLLVFSDLAEPRKSFALIGFIYLNMGRGRWLGGTAFNGVVEELKKLTTWVAHVLPVSDDGGSTAEIVRVLGGPAVGDIRSRCLRLSDQSTAEALAVRSLLGHRLPLDAQEAKSECIGIIWTVTVLLVFACLKQNPVLDKCLTWEAIKISVCRSFVVPMNHFVSAMEGARIFFQSLDAAIFLFSRVSDIPAESVVLPVISTNDRLTLGCELWDGTVIRGQNEISHPSNGSMEPINKVSSSTPALPSRIKRVFYMSSEGSNLLHEVFPSVNPTVLDQLSTVDCVIYAMGSLFTSICPSLVLLLNGTDDRETCGFSASCFVTAITDALNRTYGGPHNCLKNQVKLQRLLAMVLLIELFGYSLVYIKNLILDFQRREKRNNKIFEAKGMSSPLPSQYINTLLVPKDGRIPVDVDCLAAQGIFHVITVDSIHDPKVGVIFHPESLIQALGDLLSWEDAL
ncbi:hypothetical protein RHGRI_037690 [Rhododendron griersonianum]|uniref:Uncharacterized protein n=1 Tax=Rhododendron griersonianum TaxID=479676 RepID=A0AAV6HW36_9ERIC|nr:hypothetical protein RHGRI_037690 [Rhododendron griersonianum]